LPTRPAIGRSRTRARGRPSLGFAGSSALIARSQGDGRSTLLDVARSSGLRYPVVRRAEERLEQAGLLA
jgi:hypothetical protein